jgi:FkbM family methyltransferase
MFDNLRNRVSHRLARRKFAPVIEIQHSAELLRLGTDYGGWVFEPSADLQGSVIVSCGLGEDASFDIEFASRFCAKVIIVDPTPRAIRHFETIQERIGQSAVQSHAKRGQPPVDSYDLRKITNESLFLERSALWVENTKLKFFAPANPRHVSYSIINYQNNYSQETPHIEVASITLEALFAKYHLHTIPLIKFDIEGAEIQVIRHMLERSIHVRQLLVEFDEMNSPSDRSKRNVEDIDRQLRHEGYICRYFDGYTNFLYVRREEKRPPIS